LGARIFSSDSLLIEVVDSTCSFQAFKDGDWKFGGRDDYARNIGREVADAVRAGLPLNSVVKLVVVRVRGTDGTALRLPYGVSTAPQR